MKIGIDFDNTIVDYNKAFYTLASEKGLIPKNLGPEKALVKDYLLRQDRNDIWTDLQGLAYGPRMSEAQAYSGFPETLQKLIGSGSRVFIVSHRSPKPYSGLDWDLHESARTWLANQLWIQEGLILKEDIYFEATKEEKVQRIRALQLDFFVDDLLEILEHKNFPSEVVKVWFTQSSISSPQGVRSFGDWPQVGEFLASCKK